MQKSHLQGVYSLRWLPGLPVSWLAREPSRLLRGAQCPAKGGNPLGLEAVRCSHVTNLHLRQGVCQVPWLRIFSATAAAEQGPCRNDDRDDQDDPVRRRRVMINARGDVRREIHLPVRPFREDDRPDDDRQQGEDDTRLRGGVACRPQRDLPAVLRPDGNRHDAQQERGDERGEVHTGTLGQVGTENNERDDERQTDRDIEFRQGDRRRRKIIHFHITSFNIAPPQDLFAR